ncbi:MAG: fused MFS/spermidine synthase, partial [Planctomycetales bacterium]|nr:fused MFS/spermidine synthase [Planctomycetales bacterium]
IEIRWRAALLFCLVFLVGFCAIGNEIIWTRYLSLLVDNSVYSYTITLTITLFGIVLGSLVVARFLDANISRSRVFGIFQVTLALTVLGLMKTPPAVWQRLGNEFWTNAVLLVVPAIFSGASLPLAVRMAVSQLSEVARGTGQIVAFNTLGGILGSLTVGFVALPLFGLEASLLLLTGISLAIGIGTWIGLDRQTSLAIRAGLVAVSLLAWLAIAFFSGVKLPQDLLSRRGELLDFCEGYNSNLSLVRSNGRNALRIDGHWQGEAEKTHQIMAAHLPMLLHPAPKQIMVVGIGTGQTASRFVMYPIDRLVCVDIEPLLFPFVRKHFPADWMDDPRTTLVADDGRSYLAHSGDKFDVISLELGQVFRPGVAAFYTADAYEVMHDRLAEGGLVAQFIPISYFSPEQLRGVVRTFLQVFPESTLWYNRVEFLLIGRKGGRLEIDMNAVMARLEGNAAVKNDLQFSPWGGREFWLNKKVPLAGSFLLDQKGLQLLAEGGEIYGDDRPALDYEVSQNIAKGKSGQEGRILELIVPLLSSSDNQSLGAFSADEQKQARRIRQQNLGEIDISIAMRQIPELAAAQRYERIAELLSIALKNNPDHLEGNRMLGDALMYSGRFIEAEPHFRLAAKGNPGDFHSNKGLANSLRRQSRLEESIPYFQAAIAANGADPEIHNDFGIALARSHRFAEAESEFQAALRINPEFPEAQQNLQRARSEADRSR